MERNIIIYDDNNNTQRATLNLSNSLPFFNIPTIMENNHTYELETVDNTDPVNKIKRADTGNDLTYLAYIKNPYTDMVSALYFDSDSKELILTTHPDYIMLKDDRGSDVVLQAYSIGYFKESSYADSLSYPYEYQKLNIDSVTKPDQFTTLKLNVHGIKTRKIFRYRATETNALYRELNIVPFIKLKKSDVLGDNNLPTYVFVPIGSYRFRARYYGFNNPEYIYIPLVI